MTAESMGSMGAYIAQRTVKLLIGAGVAVKGAKVGILGLTFKENVPDLRNSKIPDIVAELRSYGVEPMIHDPWGDPHEAQEEYGITLTATEELQNLDALILAVSHKQYLDDQAGFLARVRDGGIVIDVKSALTPTSARGLRYWSL